MKIVCKECGSDKIIYTNNNVSFDISNITVRNKIIQSIKSQIDLKNELINEYTNIINKSQDNLKMLLKDIPNEFQAILLFKDEVLSEEEYDNQLTALNHQLKELKQSLNNDNSILANITNKGLSERFICKNIFGNII